MKLPGVRDWGSGESEGTAASPPSASPGRGLGGGRKNPTGTSATCRGEAAAGTGPPRPRAAHLIRGAPPSRLSPRRSLCTGQTDPEKEGGCPEQTILKLSVQDSWNLWVPNLWSKPPLTRSSGIHTVSVPKELVYPRSQNRFPGFFRVTESPHPAGVGTRRKLP